MKRRKFAGLSFAAGVGVALALLRTGTASAQTGAPPAPAAPLAPAVSARTAPAYILIKVDDLRSVNGRVHPRWQKLVDFLGKRRIKAGIGIICDSLEGDNPEYIRWIKAQQATGLIEFWNHGYSHRQWTENGRKLQEFVGTSYEQQKESLTRSSRLAREKLGFTLPAFGAPFNGTDATTLRVLEEDRDTTVWLYGDLKHPAKKLVLDRVGWVNIENPLFKPSVEKFVDGYKRYPDRPFFVIQGHPAQWDDAGFAQFVKIVDFLTGEGAVFTTPSEYARKVGATPPKPL
jgi:peptidoglycan/xylan/chitin deacetylase (PgdA/CDA1 family)